MCVYVFVTVLLNMFATIGWNLETSVQHWANHLQFTVNVKLHSGTKTTFHFFRKKKATRGDRTYLQGNRLNFIEYYSLQQLCVCMRFECCCCCSFFVHFKIAIIRRLLLWHVTMKSLQSMIERDQKHKNIKQHFDK